MSLAGTQPYDASKEIIWDDKNHKEHAFVTDYLLDVLKDYLDGIKSVGSSTLRAGELLHLQTSITGRLKPSKEALKDLIHALHPTPGVIINIIIFFNVIIGTYERRKNYEMVEKVGLYWHFVDLVWVFVFTFFYLV